MVFKKFITLLGLANTNLLAIPPIGNIYGKSVNLPLIGGQYIETKYINKNTAIIRLKGIINKNGTSTISKKNDEEIIELSENLLDTMKKFRCQLNKPYYDSDNDKIIFNLCFKSIISKKIVLNRIDK
tara:strand:+ start:2574 stop:2954 length:381 start_codon:yes stop_codon:yes gene_type:complete